MPIITVENASAFLDLSDELRRITTVEVDCRAVIPELMRVVKEGSRKDRLAGLDHDGNPLVPLAQSTLKMRKGDPTPFVEHGDASRAVKNLVVMVETLPGRVTIETSYPNARFLGLHAIGAGRLPVRDILGVSAVDLAEIDGIVVAECDRQVARAASGGARQK